MQKKITPFFSFENAQIYRNNNLVFEDLNWIIETDQHWIISGDNASGKSTFSEALAGKHFIRKGKRNYPFLQATDYQGQSIYTLKQMQIYRVAFADKPKNFNTSKYYYQQRFNAFDNEGLTVLEYLRQFDFNPDNRDHQQIIDQTGLRGLLNMSRIKLSSGQVRKLLIASAIIKAPQLLIIDNPYIGLDTSSRQSFNQMIDFLAFEKGIKIILCGHFQKLPNCITHQLHLKDFRIAWQGRVKDFKPAKTNTNQTSSTVLKKLKHYFAKPNWTREWKTMFKLHQISVRYHDEEVLHQFSWEVKHGEKWALLGPNGSGKSTILGLLFGDHPQVYANQVTLFDKNRKENGSIWDIKRKMGFVSPELHFFFRYNFTCSKIALSGYQDAFFVLRKPTRSEEQQTRWFFQYFNIEHLLERRFHQISTGEQRLVLLIRALVKNPPLLLLDEPFQGLDTNNISLAQQLFNEILGSSHTLVFISHYSEEIPECVNKIMNLY